MFMHADCDRHANIKAGNDAVSGGRISLQGARKSPPLFDQLSRKGTLEKGRPAESKYDYSLLNVHNLSSGAD